MNGGPDAAQREAERNLQLTKRMREVSDEILARAPESDVDPSLDRIAAVMELLGDPQRSFGVIHLTGTNGKTSTTRMVERLLRELGLSTGRFTSPHLHDLRERIALNGTPIPPEKFIAAYEEVMPYVQLVDARSRAEGGPQVSYFELVVAIAYAAFADAPVDVAVVEVGLGGEWDATNVADGTVAVATPIAIDHQRLLGSTIEEIAGEKAGIIKPDALTVVGVQEPDVLEILTGRAEEVGAQVSLEGTGFGVLTRDVAVGGQQLVLRGLTGDYPDIFLPLYGAHQAHNAVLALAAVEAFVGGGDQPVDADLVRAAFADVSSPGRLEIVRRSPTVLVDAAHNPAGAAALAEALSDSFTFHRLVGVLAVLQDKDAEAMLQILEPVLDAVVVSRTTSPRAMAPDRLGELATQIFGEDRVTVVQNLPDAVDIAGGLADEGGVSGGVLATGSIVTAAEVRMLLGATDT